MACFVVLTYVRPILENLTGFGTEGIGLMLALNATAIQAGQGIGAGFGALILHYGSVASLGLGGALCALVALVVLGYVGRISVKPVEQPEEG